MLTKNKFINNRSIQDKKWEGPEGCYFGTSWMNFSAAQYYILYLPSSWPNSYLWSQGTPMQGRIIFHLAVLIMMNI